ncbi:MAG: ThuA domain-containing protein [Kiritimatiellaeota bacterium]|nr:ThuA domain-containing protein [Kiritimatiellota bacterium]
MMQKHCLFRAATGLLALGLAASATGQDLKPVPQEDVAKLEGLIGSQLSAKPSKARKVLVFWRCEGFVHGSAIEYGNKALEVAAEKTKAFTVDFSRDYEALRPENLAKYDVVVLNNTTGLKTHGQDGHTFIEPALLDFVRSGKGIAVIHAGADNFNQAHEAAEMVGGRFWGHPWGSGGTWAFKLDEPGHPLNKAFGGKGIKFSDEIYQMSSPAYNRAKLRVLVSLDLSDEETAKQGGMNRGKLAPLFADDYAVSWVRPYGKGRVFYTSFAHDQRAFLDKAVLFHILDGVQYAIGDLKADDTPAGFTNAELACVKAATLENGNEVYAYLQDIMAHTYNEKVDAANKAKLEALLADASVSAYGKQALLRVMIAFGAPKDLKPVLACLKDPVTRDWAATVLAGAPAKEADALIMQMLPGADANQRISLIQALAAHGNGDAIKLSLNDKEQAVVAAALAGLGRIGTEQTLAALDAAKVAPELENTRLNAVAACLGNLAPKGKADRNNTAQKAARKYYDLPNTPAPLRAAAAKALLLLSTEDFFAEGMKDKDAMVRETLIRAADAVPAASLAAALKGATPKDQIAIATKLAARGETKSVAAVVGLLGSEHEEVVCAALRALSKIGAAEQVPAMFALLAKGGGAGSAANEALRDMKAGGVADQLLAIAKADAEQTGRVLDILGERMESKTIPVFETFIKSDNANVRKDAWKALEKICNDETFPQLAAWLPLVKNDEINNAENALRRVGRNADPAVRTKAIVETWGKSQAPAKRVLASLMNAASFQDASFVPLLKGALGDASNELRETAINTMGDWSSMEPFPILKDAVVSQTDDNLKKRAIRSALKLAGAQAGGEARACYMDLLKIAPDDNARMTTADSLFTVEGLDFFTTLQGMFSDATHGAAAKKLYVNYYDQKIKGQAGNTAGAEIDPKGWKGKASHAGNDAGRAFDRDLGSRWSSNTGSSKGMWFELDLGQSTFVSEVLLDTENSAGDTPNGVEAFVSEDGKSWSEVAKVDGDQVNNGGRGKTKIQMSAKGRYLKFVTLGGRPGLHWSIHEIYVKVGLDEKKVAAIGAEADKLR